MSRQREGEPARHEQEEAPRRRRPPSTRDATRAAQAELVLDAPQRQQHQRVGDRAVVMNRSNGIARISSAARRAAAARVTTRGRGAPRSTQPSSTIRKSGASDEQVPLLDRGSAKREAKAATTSSSQTQRDRGRDAAPARGGSSDRARAARTSEAPRTESTPR